MHDGWYIEEEDHQCKVIYIYIQCTHAHHGYKSGECMHGMYAHSVLLYKAHQLWSYIYVPAQCCCCCSGDVFLVYILTLHYIAGIQNITKAAAAGLSNI